MDPASPEYLVVAILLLVVGLAMGYKIKGTWRALGLFPIAFALYMFQMYDASHKDD